MALVYWHWAAVALALSYFGSNVIRFYIDAYRLRGIPTVGPSSPFSFKFYTRGREMLQEGYIKHPNYAFKVAQFFRWTVYYSGKDMIEDVQRAADDQLSFREVAFELFQLRNLVPGYSTRSPYQIHAIRGPMTKNLAVRLPDVQDEIEAAFAEEIPIQSNWISVPMMDVARRVISRTTSRLFVGLPLCRDHEYVNLHIGFTVTVFTTAQFLLAFPSSLRPLIGRILNTVPSKIKVALRLLGPLLEARLEMDEHYGIKWEGRPNDMISWLLEEAPPEQKNVYDLTLRLLVIDLAAIHTTSNTFANTLFHLAAHPEYIKPLREEIESIVEAEGWNKTSVGKMHKLDSFIKEVARISPGVSVASLTRLALKEFTFPSNGLTIPEGVFVSAAAYPTHLDEAHYESPTEFKPFRFAESQRHLVTPSHEYLTFGTGRHACPGRFFAVNEMKIMLSHLLLTYDFKLEGDGKVPPKSRWFGTMAMLDEKAKVLFRKRASAESGF